MKKRNILCLLLLLFGALTACSQAQTTAPVTTVSTTAELVKAIAPDAHIILKSGVYNISALTEEEITACSRYVSQDGLRNGELSVRDAAGLILEAEKSGAARLITENGLADVMLLDLCDNAALKGLVLGHDMEKGDCDAHVLRLAASQNVALEECALFGCGTYGIWAEDAAGLTVSKTEIYECTNGIFHLLDTAKAVFQDCQFHNNNGMFSLLGKTEVLIKDTEISKNQGALLQAAHSDTGSLQITFEGCTFQDNFSMGAPADYPYAAFTDCDISSAPTAAAYDALIARFRTLVSAPFAQKTDKAGEKSVLASAQDRGESAMQEMGYLIEDFNGDGIPELAVGECDGPINALYTLTKGMPQLVFEGFYEENCYVYMGDGHFYYYGYKSAAENGQGIFYLSKDGTKLKCESFLFTGLNSSGDVCVYSNESGSWDSEKSEKSDMTAEEFWDLDPAGAPLPLIPFSQANS